VQEKAKQLPVIGVTPWRQALQENAAAAAFATSGSPQTKHQLTKSKINCSSFKAEPIFCVARAPISSVFLCCEGKGGVLLFFEGFCSRSRRDKSRSRWLHEPALQDGTNGENRHGANVDAA
jgi:hypothetical protein